MLPKLNRKRALFVLTKIDETEALTALRAFPMTCAGVTRC